MNNPFLSDRNIFSKVVNPIRKKKQEEKKQEPQAKEPSLRPLEKNKDPIPATYKSTNNNLQQPNTTTATKPIFPATSKITFGEPRLEEQRMTFDRTLLNNPRDQMYENMMSKKSQNREDIQDLGRAQQYKTNNQSDRYPRDTYKSIPNGRNVQLNSLNQQYKFEQFRKQNNLNDCSPINASPDHINSSQFLNIDAIGDDLNKFLASSRNQQQLCKLLGIERTNKNDNPLQRPGGLQQRIEPLQIDQFAQKPVYRQTENRVRKQPIVTQSMIQYVPSQPNAFTKKFNDPPQVFGLSKPEVRMQQSEKQIPTFNYKQIDQEDSQQFQQQQYKIPSFAPVENKSKKGALAMKPSQSVRNDNLQVFNYGQTQNQKQQNTLESIIQKQMMELSINGKYRTFLTASQKIVTVKYRLQPL